MSQFIDRLITSSFLLVFIYFSFKSLVVLFLILLFITYFAMYEFYFVYIKIFKEKNLHKFLSLLFSYIYLITFSLIIWTYLTPFNNVNSLSLLFLLIICVSTDIGGYVFGKLIGGKKITRISPNKTFSGVIGSFIFALVFGVSFFNYFSNLLKIELNIVFIVIIVSTVSQVGDLLISFLKRKAKIKDTGKILPGHGGILDRIDGIMFAFPAGVILISI